MSSALRGTLLHYLMDEGQASLLVLAELSGYKVLAVRNALLRLRDVGLCVRTKTRDGEGYSLALYGLTKAGIEAALAIESEAV